MPCWKETPMGLNPSPNRQVRAERSESGNWTRNCVPGCGLCHTGVSGDPASPLCTWHAGAPCSFDWLRSRSHRDQQARVQGDAARTVDGPLKHRERGVPVGKARAWGMSTLSSTCKAPGGRQRRRGPVGGPLSHGGRGAPVGKTLPRPGLGP